MHPTVSRPASNNAAGSATRRSVATLRGAALAARRHVTADRLATAALIAWVGSLALTAFVLVAGLQRVPGFQVLIVGWLGPAVGNLAWFANPFFLFAAGAFGSGRVPIRSASLAVLLALDTFRFAEYPLDGGGASTPVYAFGWGAVLWLLAQCLLLAATGLRRLETDDPSWTWLQRCWPLLVGGLLAVVWLGAAAGLAIHDRFVATPEEAARLAGAAFKRGAICQATVTPAATPLRGLAGPLAIELDAAAIEAAGPLREPRTLLAWGIPTVRFGETDFSIDANAGGLLTSMPAKGTAGATLQVTGTRRDGIRLRLVEGSAGREVFDQGWSTRGATQRYCPDFHDLPRADQQPRRLLVTALGLPVAPAAILESAPAAVVLAGAIVERHEPPAPPPLAGIEQDASARPDDPGSPSALRQSTACPEGVGWRAASAPWWLRTGQEFVMGDKTFYFPAPAPADATCVGERVYLSRGKADATGYALHLDARTLADFRPQWNATVAIPGRLDGSPRVRSIRAAEDALRVEFATDPAGPTRSVKVPLTVPLVP